MEPPSRFNENFRVDEVRQLKKALYCLKQYSKVWFGRFTKDMSRTRYKQSQGDHMFIKYSIKDEITVLLVYVDDIIVTGNDAIEKKFLQKYLA